LLEGIRKDFYADSSLSVLCILNKRLNFAWIFIATDVAQKAGSDREELHQK
jgi:hypothetical protein